ncbi:hypothetical protein B9Z55_002360 [Caenorhabditis nigoni]|uniref:Uncharacterized protein n=1 Tax=Caenorhabditis nigoni TaxID=1611254 RepID=A0A2G5VK59_9PELO|nr:hypothetical protein B9Z55_002360 [Caenorhabditis nigoni]
MRIQSVIFLTIIAIYGYVTCEDEETLTLYDHPGIPSSEFTKKEEEYAQFKAKKNAKEEKNRSGRSEEVFNEDEFEDCDEDELEADGKESEDNEEEEEEEEDDGVDDWDGGEDIYISRDRVRTKEL